VFPFAGTIETIIILGLSAGNYFAFSIDLYQSPTLCFAASGRVSMIFTTSPGTASLFSSCAWNFVVFFTNFP
jgi:hypothetical protein